MRILNLYAGIGGNRKLWGDGHDITAIEYNPEIADVYRTFFPDDTVIVTDAHQYLLDHYNEFDFIWSSPPCQTHSRARMWGWKNDNRVETKYPDLNLYQEIIFLDNYYDGLWLVENVKPYYPALITPRLSLGRHLLWSNFYIPKIDPVELDINRGDRTSWAKLLGMDISGFKIKNRKDQIYRNTFYPETGLHIFNSMLKKESDGGLQGTLFNDFETQK